MKGRKIQNTIWELNYDVGHKVSSFEGLSRLGVNHFKNLFTSQQETSIAEIINIVGLFPHFVDAKENESLMKELSEQELLAILHSFPKDKSLGQDGWPIEFYLDFCDLIGKDLLKVVEESRKEGFIHAPLNSTFIALISSKDNPRRFEDFRPISLCNCLYKIISKIIAKR